jgi:hypothetical protein
MFYSSRRPTETVPCGLMIRSIIFCLRINQAKLEKDPVSAERHFFYGLSREAHEEARDRLVDRCSLTNTALAHSPPLPPRERTRLRVEYCRLDWGLFEAFSHQSPDGALRLSLGQTVGRPGLASTHLHSASCGGAGVVTLLLTNLFVTTPPVYGRSSPLSLCVGA